MLGFFHSAISHFQQLCFGHVFFLGYNVLQDVKGGGLKRGDMTYSKELYFIHAWKMNSIKVFERKTMAMNMPEKCNEITYRCTTYTV
jgi:hypothetical protein